MGGASSAEFLSKWEHVRRDALLFRIWQCGWGLAASLLLSVPVSLFVGGLYFSWQSTETEDQVGIERDSFELFSVPLSEQDEVVTRAQAIVDFIDQTHKSDGPILGRLLPHNWTGPALLRREKIVYNRVESLTDHRGW